VSDEKRLPGPSISLSLDILPAITPDGPGQQLVIRATDQNGTITRTETIPDVELEPPPPPGPHRVP
jgi:hypothetical protein